MQKDSKRTSVVLLGLIFIGLLGFLALGLTHLLWLSQVAGWHYDEAWAGNYAYRIATEPGFWPLSAMTPYTAAWSHWIAAVAFHLFGTSVFVYRATGILEVMAGLALIATALWRRGERETAALLPWVVAFFPAIVMNHRWVIEMNTLFVLCAGLVVFGLSWGPSLTRNWFARTLIVLGVFVGVTSHVLFLAPVLALWFCGFVSGNWGQGENAKGDRLTVSLIALGLILFFFKIMLTLPPEDAWKAKSLIILSTFVLAMQGVESMIGGFAARKFGADSHFASGPSRYNWGKRAMAVPAIFGIVLLVPFFIFAEGSWLALFSAGRLETVFLIGTVCIPVILTAVFAVKSERGTFSIRWEVLAWLPVCLILILVMVVKPGPRYYEIPFLYVATLFAWVLSRLQKSQAAIVMILWVLFGSAQLGVNYFKPDLEQTQIDHEYHLWRFHDSSVDMLPTQRVATRLAQEGCTYDELEVSDYRLDECLRFLSHGADWVTRPGGCRLGHKLDVLRQPGNEGQFTIVPLNVTGY
jgi:hypothetical protein